MKTCFQKIKTFSTKCKVWRRSTKKNSRAQAFCLGPKQHSVQSNEATNTTDASTDSLCHNSIDIDDKPFLTPTVYDFLDNHQYPTNNDTNLLNVANVANVTDLTNIASSTSTSSTTSTTSPTTHTNDPNHIKHSVGHNSFDADNVPFLQPTVYDFLTDDKYRTKPKPLYYVIYKDVNHSPSHTNTSMLTTPIHLDRLPFSRHSIVGPDYTKYVEVAEQNANINLDAPEHISKESSSCDSHAIHIPNVASTPLQKDLHQVQKDRHQVQKDLHQDEQPQQNNFPGPQITEQIKTPDSKTLEANYIIVPDNTKSDPDSDDAVALARTLAATDDPSENSITVQAGRDVEVDTLADTAHGKSSNDALVDTNGSNSDIVARMQGDEIADAEAVTDNEAEDRAADCIEHGTHAGGVGIDQEPNNPNDDTQLQSAENKVDNQVPSIVVAQTEQATSNDQSLAVRPAPPATLDSSAAPNQSPNQP